MVVVVELCKKLVKDMHYDARVNCVINWYAEYFKVSLPKEKARRKHMQAWQYLQVPPQWCRAKKRCFRMMVQWWTSPEYKVIHDDASDRRGMMGGATHRQGNLCLAAVVQKKERETGGPVSLFRAYVEIRQRDKLDPKLGMWLTKGHMLRGGGGEYTSKFKEKNGKDSDPLNEPFDPEVAVLAGEGRRNGRLWIGDGSVNPSTIPSLSKVRASRSSSNPGIETRPKPSLVSFSEIQAHLNEETKKREEAERREQQVQATLAEQQRMMAQQQEMLIQMAARFATYDSHIAALSGMSGAPPLGSLPPLPPFPPVSFGMVHPSAGSNNVTLGPSPNQHESPVTPATASQAQTTMPSHPHTSTIRRAP